MNIIRPAQPSDIPAMRMLERQADLTAHWSAREYDALFDDAAPKRIALAAQTESHPSNLQGFLIARCDQGEWELENIVVAADRQRLGVGSALIQELLRCAESSGATSVLLEVRASNFAALRLYQKLGFREEGRRAGYYQHPTEDALLLRRKVAGM